MLTKTALAAWGSGALVASAAGVLVATQLTAGAATSGTGTTSGSTQTAATSAKVKPNPGNNGNGKGKGGAGSPGKAMEITHVLVGALSPGGTSTLTIRVVNPNPQDARIASVTGSISNIVSGPGVGELCTLEDFKQPVYTGDLGQRVLADRVGHVELELTLEMNDSTTRNQERCKDADFDYSFLVTANQA